MAARSQAIEAGLQGIDASLGRPIIPAAAAFLLSDDASYVTGTNTEISGGSV